MHTYQPNPGFISSDGLRLAALAHASRQRARGGTGASFPEGSSIVLILDAIRVGTPASYGLLLLLVVAPVSAFTHNPTLGLFPVGLHELFATQTAAIRGP